MLQTRESTKLMQRPELVLARNGSALGDMRLLLLDLEENQGPVRKGCSRKWEHQG